MSTPVELVLIKGNSYAVSNKRFINGKPQAIDKDLAAYLMGTGRFKVHKGEVPSTSNIRKEQEKRIKLRKPDNTTPKKSQDESEPYEVGQPLPTFRSKKDLAEFASLNLGYDFEVDVSELKMKDMLAKVEEIAAEKHNKKLEASKKGAITV